MTTAELTISNEDGTRTYTRTIPGDTGPFRLGLSVIAMFLRDHQPELETMRSALGEVAEILGVSESVERSVEARSDRELTAGPAEPWCGHWIHTLYLPGNLYWPDWTEEIKEQVAAHAKMCPKVAAGHR